ncbi:amino acid ABC transporter permease [Neoaquamicrobium sediminum]|uniref:amino acid ABC transporter permease n=1 Tax=Neoaquamicrobium sediminum TaxID=1849104 RepID=UPI00156637CA|nr:ABC transporter permease subunit [Mesorhizobium sediminum]NRC56504.1 ABC transporter permease subunit [Mesorhizobium sediminum]
MAEAVSPSPPSAIDDAMGKRFNNRERRVQRRRRALIYQVLVVLCAAFAFGYFSLNVVRNLEATGLTGGFSFLWQEAGFSMSFSLIPMTAEATYGRIYIAGILNTLFVASMALVLATLLGVAVGLARSAPARPIRVMAKVYVEAVRNVPLLLILIFTQTVALRSLPVVRDALNLGGGFFLSNRGIYLPAPLAGPNTTFAAGLFVLGLVSAVAAYLTRPRVPVSRARERAPMLVAAMLAAGSMLAAAVLLEWERPKLGGFDFNGGIKLMPELVALLVALVVYNAAFIAEIVRQGIISVDKGQVEAARALGFRHGFIQRRIVLPQAMRLMIPPITNQYVHLVKASSLATVVGFPDLVNVFLGTSLNQTGRAVEIVILTALVYLTINVALGSASAAYNSRKGLKQR